MPDDDNTDLPSGRFARFRRLATLGAKLSADAAALTVKKLAGADTLEVAKGSAEKLVSALGEMKGLAMKIGQAVSMDPEAFPPEARAVLARLQNQAPPMPYDKVAAVVREELGAEPEQLYAEFSREPMAAASLGQVHRATTHDGQHVVVKVQYPEIAQGLESDLDNLGMLVKTFGNTPLFDGRKHFADVRAEFMGELDYRREARLLDTFTEAMRPWPDLLAPHHVPQLSSGRVLTLQLLEGRTLKEFMQSGAPNDERFRVSSQLIRATWGPFLKTGVMHVDPHPGNFLVMADGKLGVLDYGAVKHFSDTFLEVNRVMFRKGVLEEKPDVVELSRRSGFEIQLGDDEVRELVDALLDRVCRPMREPTYDYAKDDSQLQVRRLMQQNPTKFIRFVPPVEAPLFFRTIGGLAQNLKVLGANGPFRDAYLELIPLTH